MPLNNSVHSNSSSRPPTRAPRRWAVPPRPTRTSRRQERPRSVRPLYGSKLLEKKSSQPPYLAALCSIAVTRRCSADVRSGGPHCSAFLQRQWRCVHRGPSHRAGPSFDGAVDHAGYIAVSSPVLFVWEYKHQPAAGRAAKAKHYALMWRMCCSEYGNWVRTPKRDANARLSIFTIVLQSCLLGP